MSDHSPSWVLNIPSFLATHFVQSLYSWGKSGTWYRAAPLDVAWGALFEVSEFQSLEVAALQDHKDPRMTKEKNLTCEMIQFESYI